ncbi:MAG: PAS domain-containing protein [Anaerolineae bacterium]|nr:PAS domain-containing protein [Anaerolineae bacterium]
MYSPLYSLILGFNAVLALLMATLVWRRRATPGSVPFVLLLLAAFVWAFFSALEHAVWSREAQVLFSQIEYLGIVSAGPLWLIFALAYSQQRHLLTRRNIALLFIVPVVILCLVATNRWHGLIWPEIRPISGAPYSRLIYEHGPAFFVTVAYGYLCVVAGTMALVWMLVRYSQVYRRQAWAVLLGLALPWIANLVYVTGNNPLPGIDPTPIAFILSGVVYTWTIFRFQLFDLAPIARDALIERLTDAVLVLDAQNRIVDLNPQARAMFDVNDHVVGQQIKTALSGWEALIALCCRSMEETRAEFVHGGAASRHFELQVILLHDRDDRLTGRLLVLRDISERKQLEQARDNLMHTIVHDLRSPLSGVNMALNVIVQGQAMSETQQQMIGIAQNSVNRMSMLIDSILDVSRMESGQMPLARSAVRLEALIATVIQLQTPLTQLNRLRLIDESPDNLPAVWGDAEVIGRVLQNLVDNAIKFTPAGGEIRMTARHDPETAQMLVSVADNGPGISPEVQERLFQKFATGDTPGRGTGLGLAFCRLAVEAHGGRIWVESEPGKGTTFTFSLPVKD